MILYIFSNIFNDKKVYLFIISLFFFAILYSLCNKNEFQGWISIEEEENSRNSLELAYLKKFFKNNTKYNDGYLSKDNFKNLPIIYKNNKFELLLEYDEKEYKNDENINAKNILYDLYDKQKSNKINLNTFLKMPIFVNILPNFIKKNSINKQSKLMSVSTMFDRLYFSSIVQSNLGLGDVFPASKRTRIILMLQTFVTYIIIALPKKYLKLNFN